MTDRTTRLPARQSPVVPLALSSLLAGLALPAPAAGTALEYHTYEWRFVTYVADGQGGPSPMLEGPVEQFGGALDEQRELEFPDGYPNMEIHSNAGATTFWVTADAPSTGDPNYSSGAVIGAGSNLAISQIFRKDEPDATLSFTLTGAMLMGLDPSPAGDDKKPTAALLIDVRTTHALGFEMFKFQDSATITGLGDAWDYDEPANFSLGVNAGGLDQAFVQLTLTAPFTQQIDLSGVLVGQEFQLLYFMDAYGIDTAQYDSGATAFGRDPVDTGTGTSFDFTGLTPIEAFTPVPEPGAAALLATGSGLLVGARRRRLGRP